MKSKGSILIFLAVSVLFLWLANWMYTNNVERLKSGITVQAQVTKFETSVSKGKTMYTPVVQFTTKKGEAMNVPLEISSGKPEYSIGEKIKVIYQPNNPYDVMTDSWFGIYGFSAIFGGFGGLGLLVVIYDILRRIGLFGM